MPSQFRLLLLLDDDYGGIAKQGLEELCQNLCSKLEISTWKAASNIQQLMNDYEKLDIKPRSEEILIVSDVVDFYRNARLDEEVIREVYQKGWGGEATLLFFSSEMPMYFPKKTFWLRNKAGYPEKDANSLKEVVEGKRSADKSGEDNWDDIGRKVATPWRFEYFLEVSLRLLALDNEENVAVVKKIILGEEPQETEYKQMCYKYKPYQQVCGELSKDEQSKFSDLKQKVEEFLNNHSGKNMLTDGNKYQKCYNEIYHLLFHFSSLKIKNKIILNDLT